MSAIAAERFVNESYAHWHCTSDKRLIFLTITRCYGKRVTVFPIAIAAGDRVKYQLFVYGSFVWEIQVRYNNKLHHILLDDMQLFMQLARPPDNSV